jgi:N-methylhydantoinase A
MDPATLKAAFASLAETGREYLSSEGITPETISYERSVDFRYHGQEYVMTIPLPSRTIDMAAVRASFDVAYERQYGHSSPEGRVEMANIRLAALGRLPRPVNAPPASGAPSRLGNASFTLRARHKRPSFRTATE